MRISGEGDSDPRAWCAAIALAFLALILFRIGTPSTIYFDEVHYVNAARKLLSLTLANREHPLFAKEIIAGSVAAFGDNPPAWRVPSALFGAFGLYAFGRLTWYVSRRRPATIFAMLLAATNFSWFVQSRIAMLDIYAASFALAGLWLFAGALESDRPRLRLALCGLAVGLAMASKWSAVPLAVLPGLAFLTLKLNNSSHSAIKQVGLAEAFTWLGMLPLAIYWLTFTPAFFYHDDPHLIGPLDFWAQHERMISMQDSVIKPHPYQSVWWQWMLNLRPIWYLYENVDGAQRGVLMLGNPLTMLIGLAALVWCVWAATGWKRRDALIMLVCYAATFGLWLFSGKPVQFYYHYLLPGMFLTGALALALDGGWRKGPPWRVASLSVIAGSVGLFTWFWPILSAAPLAAGKGAFVQWMWLDSWR